MLGIILSTVNQIYKGTSGGTGVLQSNTEGSTLPASEIDTFE